MKTLSSTLMLVVSLATASTALADHGYGGSYAGSSGGGAGYRGEQAYHDGLQHNSFHRQQAHEQLHDTLSHRNYDQQFNGLGNVSSGLRRSSSYSNGFYPGNGYSTPNYRSFNYGGSPSMGSSGCNTYRSPRLNGGYGTNWNSQW